LLEHADDVIVGFLADGGNLHRVGVIKIYQQRCMSVLLYHKQRFEGLNIVGQNSRQSEAWKHFIFTRKRCFCRAKRHAVFYQISL